MRYLEEGVLRTVAAAAAVATDRFAGDRFVLSAATFEGAAAVIGRLADEEAEPAGGEDVIAVLLLPAWELEYLWQVLTTFHRARAGEPEAADLRELLQDLGHGHDRTLEQITEDLLRVVAVLTLDTPAVRTLAAAAARTLGLRAGDPPDAAAVPAALEEVRAAWHAVGIR
ncbi:hypothetical protein [Streptomyces sp. enrichment culture]|uniref:hypothetical protein n=1 Tax=Streptomyces sp. enrichment culture TaxID=1795815 RepID=UPI003F573F36